MAALAPLSALSAVLLIALICGSVVAQNAAAVLQAGPQLLASIFLLHAGGWALGLGLGQVAQRMRGGPPGTVPLRRTSLLLQASRLPPP